VFVGNKFGVCEKGDSEGSVKFGRGLFVIFSLFYFKLGVKLHGFEERL